MSHGMVGKRFYRDYVHSEDLKAYTVVEQESDLQIYAKEDIGEAAKKWLEKYRRDLQHYIGKNRDFLHSLTPTTVEPWAPEIVRHMAGASLKAEVGPMAAVAGAISEYVGKKLLEITNEVMIENGGDIFIKTDKVRRILIYAGSSPFSNQIVLKISPQDTPMGVCTSAGTVGHSLSFGKADAVVVLSKDTPLADAAATAIGNLIQTAEDIEDGINYGKAIEGIEGIMIIVGDKLGAWGNISIEKP